MRCTTSITTEGVASFDCMESCQTDYQADCLLGCQTDCYEVVRLITLLMSNPMLPYLDEQMVLHPWIGYGDIKLLSLAFPVLNQIGVGITWYMIAHWQPLYWF